MNNTIRILAWKNTVMNGEIMIDRKRLSPRS